MADKGKLSLNDGLNVSCAELLTYEESGPGGLQEEAPKLHLKLF